MMCQKGEEQYSEPEIVYYGGEALLRVEAQKGGFAFTLAD